jgi:hypothetical protein
MRRIRYMLMILAIIASAFCANSFNTSLIVIWIAFVVLPVVILYLTTNELPDWAAKTLEHWD